MSDLEARIREKLQSALTPTVCELENESHKHGFSRGPEGHFKLLLISDVFLGMTAVERHQKIYSLLKSELADGVHAIAIRALTVAESEKSRDFESPECRHRGRST